MGQLSIPGEILVKILKNFALFVRTILVDWYVNLSPGKMSSERLPPENVLLENSLYLVIFPRKRSPAKLSLVNTPGKLPSNITTPLEV